MRAKQPRWLVVVSMLATSPYLSALGSFVQIPGGEFRSVLNYEDTKGLVRVAPFQMMRWPVTNAQFLDFVRAHVDWQKNHVPAVLAENRYLSQWAAPLQLGKQSRRQQPVVNISWFAATAYCESLGARLPTWNEWEFVAAADTTRADARGDPIWRDNILNWYARPSNKAVQDVGQAKPNIYGVGDLHGLIWEWVDDFSAMLVSGDNREQKDPDRLKFCGAGALSVNDKENYAILMRVAMLSSLEANHSTSNLGFRCARDAGD
jgi:formylglycine-generating enzyme